MFLGGNVGQSAAAGGNAGYFKLTPTLLFFNFFLLFILLAVLNSQFLLYAVIYYVSHSHSLKNPRTQQFNLWKVSRKKACQHYFS